MEIVIGLIIAAVGFRILGKDFFWGIKQDFLEGLREGMRKAEAARRLEQAEENRDHAGRR